MNSTYEFTLKNGPKVKMKNFWKTKSSRTFLEGLKRKIDKFNPNFFIYKKKNHLLKPRTFAYYVGVAVRTSDTLLLHI